MRIKQLLFAVTFAICLTSVGIAQQPIRDADRFSGLSFDELKPVFDNLALILKREPDKRAYIFIYGGRRSCIGEVNERINRIRNYLTNNHKIAVTRIALSDGGHREEMDLEYFILSPDVTELPRPVPTIDPKQVEWLKGNDRRCDKQKTSRSRRGRV